jgi:hypothetical protein
MKPGWMVAHDFDPARRDAVPVLRAVGQIDGQLDEVDEPVGRFGDPALVK